MPPVASIPPALANEGHVVAATRVLVIDDSPTMRALIASVLERIPNVEVVGTADGAAEARDLIPRLRPEVLTLDVEMPGMNGIEYLGEIMASRPMPVIMFSTRTGEGTEDTIEAMRLGAFDCICKPRVASPSDFDAVIVRLGHRIAAARSAKLRAIRAAPRPLRQPPIDWNGRLLAIGSDATGGAALNGLLETFPANCPPTIVVRQFARQPVAQAAEGLAQAIAPQVAIAADGMAIAQGTVYLAPPGDHHLIVDGWPGGRLRLVARDPVAGARPSISILFASVARAAAGAGIGVLLARAIGEAGIGGGGADEGADGGAGLQTLHGAGAYTFTPAGAGGFTLARNDVSQTVAGADLAVSILRLASR